MEVNSQIVSSGTGDITLAGTSHATGGADNYGIIVDGGSTIESTGAGVGAGNITLTGTGGAGAGTDHGILLDTTAEVTAAGPGTITMTGQAARQRATISKP